MSDLQSLIDFMEGIVEIHRSRLAEDAPADDASLAFLEAILADLRSAAASEPSLPDQSR